MGYIETLHFKTTLSNRTPADQFILLEQYYDQGVITQAEFIELMKAANRIHMDYLYFKRGIFKNAN